VEEIWKGAKEVLDPEREKIRQETEKLLKELKSKKRKSKKKDAKEDKAAKEVKEMLRIQREKYVKRQKRTEDDIMEEFEKFREKLYSNENADSWVHHKLTFEQDESESKVKDPSLDDGLVVFDPLSDHFPTPGERYLNKHQQKLRAKKKLEKW